MESSDEVYYTVENLLHAVFTSLAHRTGKDVFAIGGAVEKPSSSLAIRWDRDDQGQCRKLLLPTSDDDAVSQESFDLILKDCEPATFGVGGEEVLDEEYRKAGKLDDTRFSTSFNPYGHGILDTINQVLAQGAHREALGVRAEMYKLNVMSLLRSVKRLLTRYRYTLVPLASSSRTSILQDQIARWARSSSVFQLRTKAANSLFDGGRRVDFDWGPKSADTIQWAAFFSGCEHEVLQVTEGHRMTLTYNLFWTSYALDQGSLHFFSALEKLLECDQFLKEGGLVGFTCTHAYPHTSNSSVGNLHHTLKGIDMVVYQALKRLLGSARVTAVLDDDDYKESTSEWRMDSEDEDWRNSDCISDTLVPTFTCDDWCEDEPPDPGAIEAHWQRGPTFPRRGVTWLDHQPNSQTAKELAVAFVARYGNSPIVDAYYSSAAIVARANAFKEQ
ncbi:hypothetical protein ACHAPT_000613 [Fusarium lateritium]